MKIIIITLLISFIGDHLLQAPVARKEKHKSTSMLAVHTLTWSLLMWWLAIIFCYQTQSMNPIKWWMCITIIHFLSEWCFVRAWTNMWYQRRHSEMVILVCAEQLILNGSMILLLIYFVGGK